MIGLLCAVACLAQEPGEWEIGASVGYGWYHDGSIYGAGETIQAGIRNRFAAGAVLGEDLYDYISGEFRWLYQDGHPFIQGPGFKTDIQGNSNTFTYDALFYFRPKHRRLRPFVAAGAGAKDYVIAGPAPVPQPVPTIATLATEDHMEVRGRRGRRGQISGTAARPDPRRFPRLSDHLPPRPDYARARQHRPRRVPAIYGFVRRQRVVLRAVSVSYYLPRKPLTFSQRRRGKLLSRYERMET